MTLEWRVSPWILTLLYLTPLKQRTKINASFPLTHSAHPRLLMNKILFSLMRNHLLDARAALTRMTPQRYSNTHAAAAKVSYLIKNTGINYCITHLEKTDDMIYRTDHFLSSLPGICWCCDTAEPSPTESGKKRICVQSDGCW